MVSDGSIVFKAGLNPRLFNIHPNSNDNDIIASFFSSAEHLRTTLQPCRGRKRREVS